MLSTSPHSADQEKILESTKLSGAKSWSQIGGLLGELAFIIPLSINKCIPIRGLAECLHPAPAPMYGPQATPLKRFLCLCVAYWGTILALATAPLWRMYLYQYRYRLIIHMIFFVAMLLPKLTERFWDLVVSRFVVGAAAPMMYMMIRSSIPMDTFPRNAIYWWIVITDIGGASTKVPGSQPFSLDYLSVVVPFWCTILTALLKMWRVCEANGQQTTQIWSYFLNEAWVITLMNVGLVLVDERQGVLLC